MKWPFTKRLTTQQATTVWDQSTVRDAEQHRRNYRPNDIESQETIRRAIGVVHDCASTNARVCSSIPLRLMRRVDVAGKRAGIKLGMAERKSLASGVMGKQVASFMEASGEVEEVIDHPVLDVLGRPSDTMVGLHASWYSFYFREICGKSFELIGMGPDGPQVLLPMPAQFVELTYDEDGHDGYIYARSESDVAHLDLDEVIMYRHHPSRFNPWEGEGPLAGVLPEADLLVQNIMHDLAFVGRGNRPDSMLTVEDPIADPRQLEELERRINSKHGGAMNNHKTYVASGKINWTPFVWPEKELQSLAKVEHYEKRVRAAFGHTESMADSNDSTYASALVGYSEQYMGATIRPRLIADAAQKNALLLPLFGIDPTVYCFVYDDPVKRDEEVLSNRVRADIAAGVMTINEGRAELNMDRLDDPGADKVRINGQTLETLDAAPAEPAGGGFDIPSIFRSVKSAEGKAPAKYDHIDFAPPEGAREEARRGLDWRAEYGRGGTETGVARARDIANGKNLSPETIGRMVSFFARHEVDKQGEGFSPGEDGFPSAGRIAWALWGGDAGQTWAEKVKGQMEAADGEKRAPCAAVIFKGMAEHELPEWRNCSCGSHKNGADDDIADDPLMRRVFEDHLDPVQREFQRVVGEMQDEVFRSAERGQPADMDALIDAAARDLQESMVSVVAEAVKGTLDMADASIDEMFDVVNRAAIEHFQRHSLMVANDIARTTQEMVYPAIQRGLEEGLSIDEVAAEMSGVPEYRAERIARTEIQNAAQGSRYVTLGEVGVEEVEWVNAPGASAAHREIARRGRRKIGEPFVKAGETIGREKYSRDIYYPPARPNCRCSIRAIFPEE